MEARANDAAASAGGGDMGAQGKRR
uniref:Uncharacterized protein n=1 Tax=Arundo donax TaxID=35708 RepID=A0A0A9CFC8_ARUDO